MKTNNDLLEIIQFVLRYKWWIVSATLFGAAVSIVVALSIPVKYKSTAVFFPASSASVSKDLLTDISQTQKDLLSFGGEAETEQFLQILQSDYIKNTVIQKFNLFDHYNISLNEPLPYTRMAKKYDSNISFRKTQFDAIAVDVLDTDPQMAANIANDICNLLDSTLNNLQKQRASEALNIVEIEYLKLKQEVALSEDSLLSLADSDKMIRKFLTDQLETDRKQLALLKAKYAEARVDANNTLPHKYMVETAQVSEKKSYPVRWLIVVLSTMATFVMSLVILAFLDFAKAIKAQLNNSNSKRIGFDKQ